MRRRPRRWRTDAADPVPVVRHIGRRTNFVTAARPMSRGRPIRPPSDDAAWAAYLYLRDNPQGDARGTVAASAWLRAVFQLRARHRHRPDRRDLQARRGAAMTRPPRRSTNRNDRGVGMTQPFRTSEGGRIDRSAPLRFSFDGRHYRGFRRRYTGLRPAGERRVPGRALVQISSPARHPVGRLRGTQRAGHVDRGAGRRHAEPARHAGRTVRRPGRPQPEPLSLASLRPGRAGGICRARCCPPGSTTRHSWARGRSGSVCMSRRSGGPRVWGERPATGPGPLSASLRSLRGPDHRRRSGRAGGGASRLGDRRAGDPVR